MNESWHGLVAAIAMLLGLAGNAAAMAVVAIYNRDININERAKNAAPE